ncbi:hypothetical protein ACIQCJ_02215 [Streptomyces sp. NPDC093221]|uniref:hypothetical protein n=1 Tax=unclassified Streptomyces TaxID=2593676 RepID=UPI00344D5A26
MFDVTQVLCTSSVAMGSWDVPPYGYLRNIILDVQATSGTGTDVTTSEDSPWNVISEIALLDVNGTPVVGPLDGYDLYLINKWGGATGENSDPKASPMYSAVASASGNFRFCVRIPVELSSHDALGALPNMNSASPWKLRITLASGSTLYDTAPSILPTVRIRAHVEAWGQPLQTTIVQNPPAIGTTSYWSKSIINLGSGVNTLRLPRMGALIRKLLFVYRDSSGSRANGAGLFPDPCSIHLDTLLLKTYGRDVWRHEMYRKTNYYQAAECTNGLDNGVFVEGYGCDFDGKIDAEPRDQYLSTTQSTRYELSGSFTGAGVLTILTNDVTVPSEFFVG